MDKIDLLPPDETCNNCSREEGHKDPIYGEVVELCESCFKKKLRKMEIYGLRKPSIDIKMSKLGVKTSCCNAEPYSQKNVLLCGKCNRDVTLEVAELAKEIIRKKEEQEKERIVN